MIVQDDETIVKCRDCSVHLQNRLDGSCRTAVIPEASRMEREVGQKIRYSHNLATPRLVRTLEAKGFGEFFRAT